MRGGVLAALLFFGTLMSIVGHVNSLNFTIAFNITVDNAYAVYSGSPAGVTYLGSNWKTGTGVYTSPEYYPVGPSGKSSPVRPANPMTISDADAVYIVVWSDADNLQGLLFNFIINGFQINTTNPDIQVYPSSVWPINVTVGSTFPPGGIPGAVNRTYNCTNLGNVPDRSPAITFGKDRTAPPCPEWVGDQVRYATQYSLWKAPFYGPNNNNASTYWGGVTPGIPPSARWVWYNNSLCVGSYNDPFKVILPNRCHAGEPLIFRIPSTAWYRTPGVTCATDGFSICAGQQKHCCDDFNNAVFQCYNQSSALCLTGPKPSGNGTVSVLCGNNNDICGLTCFDTLSQTCCNGTIYNITDGNDPCLCTTCEAAGALACWSKGLSCCNNYTASRFQCYNPSYATCLPTTLPDGSFVHVLCTDSTPNVNQAVCGTTCYDASAYNCCNSTLYSCPGSNPCGSICV